MIKFVTLQTVAMMEMTADVPRIVKSQIMVHVKMNAWYRTAIMTRLTRCINAQTLTNQLIANTISFISKTLQLNETAHQPTVQIIFYKMESI